MDDRLKQYEKDFKEYIVESCKIYNHGMYTDSDLEWFNSLANSEFESMISECDMKDFDYDNPSVDAEECMSYWD